MLAPADHLEYRKTVLVAGDCFAIQHARSGRHGGDCRYDERKAPAEIVPITGDEAHTVGFSLSDDPKPERARLAAMGEARRKVLAAKGSLDPTISINSLADLEEVARHFYFKARSIEGLGDKVDWDVLDKAWEQGGRWAKEVANFWHARIAAMKLAIDPTDKPLTGQMLEQLREGIVQDLEKLADAGVIGLEALAARKRPN